MAPVGGSGGWQGEKTFGSTFRGLGGLVRPKYDKSNFFLFSFEPFPYLCCDSRLYCI